MKDKVKTLLKDLTYKQNESSHAVYSAVDKIGQYAFFKPGRIAVGGIEVTSQDVAQIMLRNDKDTWTLSVNNPMPDEEKQTLTFRISTPLPEGTYSYRTKGVYPLEGETVTITPDGKGSKVIVELPDSRNAVRYNYQSALYTATPIIITIPKQRSRPWE